LGENDFWPFLCNWEKSSEIVRKAFFHADSDKIKLILLEIRRKWHFVFFDVTGKKIIKNCEKSFFNTDSEKKIRSILLEIGRKWFFGFFLLNWEKSSEIVRKALFQIKSGQFCWKSGENDFLPFSKKLGKIIRNRKKSYFSCWFRQN